MTKLIKTATKIVDGCHVKRDDGRFAGNCNDLNEADTESTFAAAALKGDGAIDKKCEPVEPVRANYHDGHHVASTLAALIQAQIETGSAFLLPGPPVIGDKQGARCRKTVRTVDSKIVAEIVKLSTQCQKAADKTATTFDALLAACLASPSTNGPKAPQTLAKSCGPVTNLSCAPFPECVVTSATDTGHALAAAIYGEPSVCGDSATEGLEECDDGAFVDGDGCDSNCTHTACGNGITTAGEECDDDNLIANDGCESDCKMTPQPKVVSGMITSGKIVNSTCEVCDAAFVSFTLDPQKQIMSFEVEVQNPGPGYYFCWPEELNFVQGSQQIGVSLFKRSGRALLAVDGGANTCGTKLEGVQVTGTISNFPQVFDMAAPFTIFFDRSKVSLIRCPCIGQSCCGNRELVCQ